MVYEAGMKPSDVAMCDGGERQTMLTNACDALEILCSLSNYLAMIGNFMFGCDWQKEEKAQVTCLEHNIKEIVRVASVCEKMAAEIKYSAGA